MNVKSNKFSNKRIKQKRIEEKIGRYYRAIDSEKIRAILDRMPKDRDTLSTIEESLSTLLRDKDGESKKEEQKF